MCSKLLQIKCLALVMVTGYMTQCTTLDGRVQNKNSLVTAPYTMSAAAYLDLAKNQVGIEQETLYLQAAGRYLDDGDWQHALPLLTGTTVHSPALANEKHILLAKVDLLRDAPRAAIASLASVQEAKELPPYYRIQFHEILADSYKLLGNATDSVMERMQLEHLYADSNAQANNRSRLWLTLTVLPQPELQTLALEAPDNSELQGWVQLALIPHQSRNNLESMLAEVEAWQMRYPRHPANGMLPSSLTELTSRLLSKPQHMALLLPLSGPLAGPGAAIKEGFLAAYTKANPGKGEGDIRLYNTQGADVAQLYQQILADGADYVVGPLSKADVSRIAALQHPVPTLLLNDIAIRNNTNAYQIGLSPTNEAKQVAERAQKKGLSRALIIYPRGAWGDEVVTAFVKQWKVNGGIVADSLGYSPKDDLNQGIRSLLRAEVSEKRNNARVKLGKKHPPAKLLRRDDFDMIFLVGYPSNARQIMPLLRYYYADNVPVYSTSSVYSGNTNARKDNDLNGIIFCDMPWVFTHQKPNKNWPEQLNSYNRLYALGMDSYYLSTQLNQLFLFPAMGVSTKTGVLYLDKEQRVTRSLAWGQFKLGAAQRLKNG